MKPALALAALLAVSPAFADGAKWESAGPHLELAYGWAQGTTAPDGTWWEHQYQTDNRLSGNVWSIGASDTIDRGWGWRIDYARLLKFSTRNIAIPNEHVVDQVINGTISCDMGPQFCLAKWNGNGHADGVHLGIFKDFPVSSLHVQPEAGLLPYYYTWNMTLEPLQPGSWSGPVSTDTGSGTFVTEYLRVTVLSDHLFARLDYDHNVKGHAPVVGIQQGKIFALFLGYQF